MTRTKEILKRVYGVRFQHARKPLRGPHARRLPPACHRETCGHRPQTAARFYGAFTQQHFVFPRRHSAHDHARVLVVNGFARITQLAWQRVTGGNFVGDGCATFTAKFHEIAQ